MKPAPRLSIVIELEEPAAPILFTFSDVDEAKAEKVVSEFMDYAEKEGILPIGKEPSEYRNDFIESYPFYPEVVSVLYQRWGSFPTFQRTRGGALLTKSRSGSGKRGASSQVGGSPFIPEPMDWLLTSRATSHRIS